ncbi:MAG: hypothetical protein CME68_12205 [Halobacteriovoraceae bacterium]|nr:hypothetical protein [Halobacteriovoraceae bacterium]
MSLLFLFVGFFPPTAAFSSEESCHNGIKILSDFDDTIKTYPSKKMAIMGFNALFKKHINVGFDHLYKGIIGQKSGSFCGEEAPLTVISASPSFLYPMVDKLLTSYQFPSHKIILRPIGKKSRQFKMEVFGKILEREEGPFLLIGDDVNEDPVIYHELKNKFPEKIEEVYIHNVENKEGFEGQKSYWTGFDLGLMEFEKGRISLKTLLKIGEKLLQSSPWKVIPPYGHCPSQGFMKRSVIEDEAILKLAEKIDLRVQEICKAR